jgi:hypothetical protein
MTKVVGGIFTIHITVVSVQNIYILEITKKKTEKKTVVNRQINKGFDR